jgi:hypothetical protein
MVTADSDVSGGDVGALVAGRPLHLAHVVVRLVVGGAHRPEGGKTLRNNPVSALRGFENVFFEGPEFLVSPLGQFESVFAPRETKGVYIPTP